jgi:hypothetical protein
VEHLAQLEGPQRSAQVRADGIAWMGVVRAADSRPERELLAVRLCARLMETLPPSATNTW